MRHRTVRVGSLVALAALLACLPAVPAAAQHGAAGGEWRYYAGDIGSTKYSPLDQINAGNVGSLRIAWTRPAVDRSILDRVPNLNFTNNLTNTPLMVDGIAYGSNAVGLAEAFDPATGETLWVQEPLDPAPQGYRGAETRGVGYWTDGSDARILVQRGQYLVALDAKTGRPYPDFGDGGRVNLTVGLGPDARYRWTGAPLVVGDVVVMGQSMTDTFITKEAVRAPVRAFDVRTGEQRWEFHTVPRAGGVRHRHVGGRFVGVLRARPGLVADERRPRARLRLSAGDVAHERHVRRASRRRQPVRPEHRLRGRRDRRARMALPDDPPRLVGLRPADGADPDGSRGSRGGRDYEGGGAAHEAGVRVRVRPRDRRAAVAESRSARCRSRTRPASAPRRRSRSPPGRRRSTARARRWRT